MPKPKPPAPEREPEYTDVLLRHFPASLHRAMKALAAHGGMPVAGVYAEACKRLLANTKPPERGPVELPREWVQRQILRVDDRGRAADVPKRRRRGRRNAGAGDTGEAHFLSRRVTEQLAQRMGKPVRKS